MRLLTKIMLGGLAVVGASAQAEAAKYLYQYVPSCSYCDYQIPFSFTFDTLSPQINFRFDNSSFTSPAYLNHGGFSVESSTLYNPDSGLTFDSLSLDISQEYVNVSYPDGDYLLDARPTQPLFYLASDGSIMPYFIESNRDPSVIGLLDDSSEKTLGSFKVTEIADDPSPTPEPATWAMMLVGFGAVGYALRRQRKVAVSFS